MKLKHKIKIITIVARIILISIINSYLYPIPY